MQKTSLGILLPLLLLAACSASTTDNTTMEDDTAVMEASSSSVDRGPFLDEDNVMMDDQSDDVVELTVSSSSQAAASSQEATPEPTAGETRVIAVTVSDWQFSPSSITVKQGEKVQIALTGEKGIHGFAVPALGINVRVEAGKTITVDIPTDRTGTFDIRCSIPCGAGHSSMKGSIIVQ